MAEMTIEELTQIADDFLRANYGMALEIPIVRNNRLRTTLGYYAWDSRKKPLRIEMAGYLLKHGAREVVMDTLYHECVHYALHRRGEPYKDGHPHFEAELARLDVSSAGTTNVGLYYVAKCTECGGFTYCKDKGVTAAGHSFVSRCCSKTVKYIGERICDGTEALI